MDVPRIFNITESAHRIHNPITPEKLATLGTALRLETGTRVLGLGSGSVGCCARGHAITALSAPASTGASCSRSKRNFALKNSASPIR